MAARRRRDGAGKTSVFWSTDDMDEKITKVITPGVSLEGRKIKQPMVTKPVHLLKPSSMLHGATQHSAGSQIASYANNSSKSGPNGSSHEAKGKPLGSNRAQGELTLKDLNPQDKKRVANLVRELAKVGEEREVALERLGEERSAFEERLQILQEEYEAVTREKEYMQKRFIQLQALLKKHSQRGISDKNMSGKLQGATGVRAEHPLTPNEDTLPMTTLASPPKGSPSFLEKIPGNKRPSEIPSGLREERLYAGQGWKSPSYGQQDVQKLQQPEQEGKEKGDGQQANQLIKPGEQQDVRRQQRQDGTSGKEGTPVARRLDRTQGTPSKISHVLTARSPGSDIDGAASSSRHPAGGEAALHLVTSSQAHDPGHRQPRTSPAQHTIPDSSALPDQPPRDRSSSEVSGVSQNFSAELDAVYRLYCREYELQLQLQQQQLELQRQQLQLQHQLQQMELMQQQQLTRTLPLATQPQSDQPRAGIVMETPTPSSAPEPAARPRTMSPATTLDPTPDVSQVFAANSSRTAPSVPRVPRAAFRDGHAQQFPRRLQQEPRVVISGVRDPDETSQSRVSTSSLASPPLRRNQREIRVPPHQDEAVMTYALYNSQGNGQSLPLFESSLESLGPGLVGRNSLRSVHSVNSQRELPSGRARAFKSDAADKQGDQFGSREGNLAPSNSSQFRSSPRPPSWASLHASHTAAGLEQRQSEADTTSVGAAGGGGGVPLLPSGPRNFSLHSDPRLEGPAERRKSPQLREGAHRLYSLQLSGSEVNPEFQDVRGLRTYGQYSEEAQNTKRSYPRSIVDLVHSMETNPSENLGSEVRCSVENQPAPLEHSTSDERRRTKPDSPDRSLVRQSSDVEETRLLEDIFFVSGRH